MASVRLSTSSEMPEPTGAAERDLRTVRVRVIRCAVVLARMVFIAVISIAGIFGVVEPVVAILIWQVEIWQSGLGQIAAGRVLVAIAEGGNWRGIQGGRNVWNRPS